MITTRSTVVAASFLLSGLLVGVGVVAHARPLSTRGTFSDGTTDIVIAVAFLVIAALIVALAIESHRPGSTARRPLGVSDAVLALVLVACITASAYGLGRLFGHSSSASRGYGVPCAAYEQAQGTPTSNCDGQAAVHTAVHAHHQRGGHTSFPWVGVGAMITLLCMGAALLALERRRSVGAPVATDNGRRGAVIDVVEISIDDLRTDPDARRAIIAAYARMEAAFATIGVARRPSEAPHEFLTRSLHELDASGEVVSRLTDLFELAKFSDHAMTVTMRDDAIDALVAIREDLIEHDVAGASNATSGSSAVELTL